ncbi:DUF2946 family protein [Luteimonas sp. e5]
MRSIFRHHWMHAPALLAALLLALVPSIGRLHQAFATADAAMPTMAMCTMDGMREVALPAWAVADPAAEADTPDVPRSAHDCDYCPLLAGLLGVQPLDPAAWLPSAFTGLLPLRDAPRVGMRHPSGLGSRGPPRLSRN